jgi:TonB family protein
MGGIKRRAEAWVDSFSNRLPDLRGVPRQKQAAIGLGVSVVIHVALLLVAALVAWLLPDPQPVEAATSAKEVPPLEIEWVLDSSTVVPAAPALLKAPALVPLQADGLAESVEAPKQAVFESSQNMVAGSELPATGTDPVPTQEGRVLPFRQFKNQLASVSAREMAEGGEKGGNGAKAEVMQQVDGLPAAVPQVRGGGEEQPPSADEAKDALLLGQKPPEAGRDTPVPAQPAEAVGAARKRQRAAASEGYSPELHQTRVEGSISNRGRPGVDAVKTPMGVYRRQVCMQIGSRWEHHRRQRMDLIALGTVRVRFFVTQQGRVEGVEILENSSNQTFSDICERSVRQAEISPPPPEVELMNDGRMEMVFTFTIF